MPLIYIHRIPTCCAIFYVLHFYQQPSEVKGPSKCRKAFMCTGTSAESDSDFVGFGKSSPSIPAVQIIPLPIIIPSEKACRCNYKRENFKDSGILPRLKQSEQFHNNKNQLVREYHPSITAHQ